MSLRINNNTEAFNTQRQLVQTSSRLTKAMEKLSSGSRINKASDDAAGLGISEKMRGQIRGLAQAQRNIQDGVGLVQTAESSLGEVQSMLQRVRELAVQSKNGAMSAAGQAAIQTEINQLASEIDRIGTTTQFNSIPLLAATGTVTFQVGANDGEEIAVPTISLGSVVGTSAFDLTTNSTTELSEIDAAIDAVSAARATFGGVQNRLEHTLAVQATSQENLVAAESRIRDVDMASEMTNLTKEQILTQAGTAMLSQANQAPNSVLSLLKG